MSNLSEKLTDWASRCNQAVDECLDLISPFLLEKPQIDPKLQWILRQLAISCNTSSISTLLLVSYVQLWDAEILLRSVIEGTIKYLFLCVGSEKDLKEKTDEYLDFLPEIDVLTQHKRVEAFLANVDRPNADEWNILREVLLNQNKVTSLKTKYPRKKSRQLKQKWAFNEIAMELSKSTLIGSDFEALRRLLSYSYGISSHLIHKDGTALKFMWERNQQAQNEQGEYEETQIAFASRQLNDLLIMANFRSLMTFKLHQSQVQPVLDLFESYKPLLDEMSTAREKWWVSQVE